MTDGSRWEGFDVDFGAGSDVSFFMPAGEGCEKEECYEGEDNGDDAVMWSVYRSISDTV